MFDFELQMRLWRSVGDAMLHGTQATLAATAAWQDKVLSASTEAKSPSSAAFSGSGFGTWPWAPQMWWLGHPHSSASAMTMPMPAANPMFAMMPWMQTAWRQSASMWPMPSWADPKAFAPPNLFPGVPAAFAPFFPAMTWAYMQTPLTMMMMSAGMPYDVASPSAKASAAVMDAADAARQQMENVFSAYRSDGGHAAAQIVTLPWSIAASFMDPAKTTAPVRR